jgi:hypothetical protein
MSTSDKFDPYHKWFGIPPSQQPPTHYRLLGLEPFEPDREVIDAAANQRIAYLQDIAAGPHGDASQRLLNEVAAARRSLLNPKTKKAYDEQLQRSSAAGPAPAKSSEIANGAAFAFDDDLPEYVPEVRSAPAKVRNQRALPGKVPPKSQNKRALFWVVGVAVGLLIATTGIIIAVMSGDSKSQPDKLHAKAQPETPVVNVQLPPPKKSTRSDSVRPADEPKNMMASKDQSANEPPKELSPKEPPPPKEPPASTKPIPATGRAPITVNGEWTLEDQEFFTKSEDGFLMLGDLSWTDYDFCCQARHEGANGAITLIVRGQAQASGSYFAQFGIGDAESVVYRQTARRLDPIVKGKGGLQPATWHKLTVKVRGKKIECRVEEKPVVEVTDDNVTDDKLSAGCIGVKGARIRFKDIQVVDPAGKVLWQGPPSPK